MVALIPARAGSKRIPGKNMKMLGGRPLIDYTITAALDSGVFDAVEVCTDDGPAAHLAMWWSLGCRPVSVYRRESVADEQPDIEWVRSCLDTWDQRTGRAGAKPDAFAILRPTSPFRTAATIQRAFERFQTQEVHSMRAVQPVKEHPGKMWEWQGAGHPIRPLITRADATPWHSRPTQTLPQVYVQNASLEMAWSWVIPAFGTISGNKVAPFFTEGYEGFDLNTMDDWREAERLIKEGLVALPSLPLARV